MDCSMPSSSVITHLEPDLDMSLGELQEFVMDRETWHAAIHGVANSWTWLSDWTELRARLPGVWGHLGLKKHYYKASGDDGIPAELFKS